MGNKNSAHDDSSDRDSDGRNSFKLESSIAAVANLSAEDRVAFENKKLFEEYECDALSSTARAMYIDKGQLHKFQLRSGCYLDDNKKGHPGPSICKLMLLELYEVEPKDGDRHDHIASRGLAKQRRENISALHGNPFVIMINFQIPGTPPVSVVAYFAVPPHWKDKFLSCGEDSSAFESLLDQFIDVPATEEARIAAWSVAGDDTAVPTPKLSPAGSSADIKHADDDEDDIAPVDGDGLEGVVNELNECEIAEESPAVVSSWYKMPQDITWPKPTDPGALPPSDFRNMRFKLIPSISEGPWVVRAAVRSVPALLGRKVVQRYFRGLGYMEVDIHVGSSVIASKVVGLCRGYTKHCAADIGIVIQGECPSELPEKLLGCVCFNRIDMDVRQKLD